MMANSAMNGEITSKESEGTTAGCTSNANMKTSWKLVKLGEHMDLLTGFPFKSAQYTDDLESIKLLRGDNIAQGYLRWEGVKLWPLSKSDDFTKYLLKRDDVILAMDRPWIEAGLKYAWVKKHDIPCLLVQRVARLRGVNGLLTEYLRYVIADQSFTDYIKPIVTGVSVPHISPSQINVYMFRLPPVELQSKIASILSAYDDLIENNTRCIKILEEMAQALYREWFVEFRFPGYEKVGMVESELGMVPEKWEIKELNEFIKLSNGKSIKPGGDGQYTAYGSNGIIGGSDQFNFENGVIIGRVGAYCGSIAYCRKRFWASDNTIVALPKDNSSDLPFIFHLLQQMELNKYAGGAAQPLLTQTTLKKLQIVVPPNEIRRKFESFAEVALAQRDNLTDKNANLRRTRDLLLPKLISGEMDVENIEVRMMNNSSE